MVSRDDKIKFVESAQLKKEIPDFDVGDTVNVNVKIVEEGKARTQLFEGIVIAKRGSGGLRSTFTVRKISFGEGVERVFPLHSPFVEKIEVKKKGGVKRSKLYYLRKKVGKATKVEERLDATQETQAQDVSARGQVQKEGV